MAKIRQELTENFADIEQSESCYGKQMWSFLRKASSQLEDLVDDVNSADTAFTEVIKYYGEDDKNMSSSEFYGIFKTFVTSYKVKSRKIV
jgi:cytokinesis protein